MLKASPILSAAGTILSSEQHYASSGGYMGRTHIRKRLMNITGRTRIKKRLINEVAQYPAKQY